MKFAIDIANNVCEDDGKWVGTISGKSATVDCWELSDKYAMGKASRMCTDIGWTDPDLVQCSRGLWSQTELEFLVSQDGEFHRPEDVAKQWPYFAYLLFYWP